MKVENTHVVGSRVIEGIDVDGLRIRNCRVSATTLDTSAWPVLRNSTLRNVKLGRGTKATGFVLEDVTVDHLCTVPNLIFLACLLRHVRLVGRVEELTVRQFGGIGGPNLDASADAIRSATGDEWALDLSEAVPAGTIELSLAVEPWQIIPNDDHTCRIPRSALDRITDEDLLHIRASDRLASVAIGVARLFKQVRTSVVTSTTPNPSWFRYLEDRNLVWKEPSG